MYNWITQSSLVDKHIQYRLVLFDNYCLHFIFSYRFLITIKIDTSSIVTQKRKSKYKKMDGCSLETFTNQSKVIMQNPGNWI